jgi:PAS domain S-box-containing protein
MPHTSIDLIQSQSWLSLQKSLTAMAALSSAREILASLNQLLASEGAEVAGFLYSSEGTIIHSHDANMSQELSIHVVYPRHRENHNDWKAQPKLVDAISAPTASYVVYDLVARDTVLGGIVMIAPIDTHEPQTGLRMIAISTAATYLRALELELSAVEATKARSSLNHIASSLTKSLNFDDIAEMLLEEAQSLFEVEAVALFTQLGDESIYQVYRSRGLSRAYAKAIRLDSALPQAQAVIQGRTPVQLYDLNDGFLSSQHELIRNEKLASILMAPIISDGHLVGGLALYTKKPRHFTLSELELAGSIAEQASIAFTNARLHSDLLNVSSEINQTRNLMQDGLLVVTQDGTISYFNDAAGSLLGLSTASIGAPVKRVLDGQTLLSKADADAIEFAIREARTGVVSRTSFNTNEEESPRQIEALYAPYLNPEGNLIGSIINLRDITLLYREREKLKTIQDTIQDGMALMDHEGTILESNPEWEKLFHQLATEGETFVDAVERAEAHFDQPLQQIFERVLQGKRVTGYADVAEHHLQVSFGPLMLLGQVEGVVATARDITPLINKTIEANEMNAKAQRHLRELSQLADLTAVIGFNVEGIYQKYLTKITALLSATKVSMYLYLPQSQELVRRASTLSEEEGRSVLNLSDDYFVARAFVGRKPVTEPCEEDRPAALAIPIVHHSKTLGVVAIARNNDFAEHDVRLLGLVANRLAVLIENSSLYHDVNARRERWEAVFRFTEEGIVIFDHIGKIVGFNPASVEMTQFTAAEANGQHFTKIIKTVTAEGTDLANVSPINRVLDEGVTITKSEQLVESRSGIRLWTEISYSPIFDDAGQVTSGIAIIRNTQKDREVEEIKSDFISIVSHELRTPLTAIKGFLSMVLKNDFGPLGEKQAHFLSRVYQSNQRMIDLVEDLLESSHIESGKINLTITPVAMEGIVADVVAEEAGKAAAKQVLVKVNRRQRLPLVLADETRLHQILMNLIDNAIKYSMPETEIRVTFKITGDELVTTVADQGVGITASQFDRLFTKFGRIYNPMSVQAGGTGLGLYIVKNLVESHGGRIWVTSREGQGSRFCFSLPIAKQLPLLA